MLSTNDLEYFTSNNISEQDIEMMLDLLKKNNNFLNLIAPASIGNGILTANNLQEYSEIFDCKSKIETVCRFVPASGAATRMFENLIAYSKSAEQIQKDTKTYKSVENTINELHNFAFYNKLQIDNNTSYFDIIDQILYSKLDYANTPKALIEFHKYENKATRTAFEEHIHEAMQIAENINLHFTISPEHKEKFDIELKNIQNNFSIVPEIDFSYQEPQTNTISINNNGEIVRQNNGTPLLRPGGHGSLIQNLNKLNSSVVFIKNIDNIAHADYLSESIVYKKIIGGLLLEIKDYLHNIYLKISSNTISNEERTNAKTYLNEKFGFVPTCDNEILEFINRPIRVCSMVRNTGEPGGGPFWVRNANGVDSLQIVEKAQIDTNEASQSEILQQSTHFNPVDIVCYLKDTNGNKFDLNEYVDKESCFVSEKQYNAQNIRILEHPGLWNGAMANWLTIFVELPLSTFNPVKELNDLLREKHQPNRKCADA